MEHTFINFEDKESSAPGDSDKGSCTEALHIGVAEQNPAEQGAGENPLTGEEHSSPGSIVVTRFASTTLSPIPVIHGGCVHNAVTTLCSAQAER